MYKVVYGVHGVGHGHATRSFGIIQGLIANGFEVEVFAGGNAFRFLSKELAFTKVHEVPVIEFAHKEDGSISRSKTTWKNRTILKEVVFNRGKYAEIQAKIMGLRPDAIVSDSEIHTAWSGKRLGLPVICIDHYGVLAKGKPRMSKKDWLLSRADVLAYSGMVPFPDGRLISSFYKTKRDIDVIPPIIRSSLKHYRDEVCNTGRPLVYFPAGMRRDELDALGTLPCNVDFFGKAKSLPLNCRWRSPEEFDKCLLTCDYVITSAGNQLPAECAFLGKPILVRPEDSVEQRVNAHYVVSEGLGKSTKRITEADLSMFEIDKERYRDMRNWPDVTDMIAGYVRKVVYEH